MRPDSFWLATTPRFSSECPDPVGGHADVAVIGAGLTGLSCALALAERGIDVRLLEAKTIAAEASGRNGGHCNNGLAGDFGSAVQRFGVERAREMYRAFDAGVDLVQRLVGRHAIDCGFRRSGKLKLAAKPQHFESLQRARDMLAREVDPDTAIITRQNLPEEIASERFHGGLLMRRSASLHVGRFALGLAEAAAKAGAAIHQNSPVLEITRSGTGFVVTTPGGALMARDVVIATGASSRGPFSWFRRRIVPIGSFLIVTEPLDSRLVNATLPGRRTYTTTKHVGNYFRLTDDNRVVFGGRARFAMSSPASDLKSGRVLKQQLADMLPALANCRIDYCWGGIVDLTTDRLPRAGLHDGMHYAMGYSGHGVQMSVYMGDVIARTIAGEDVRNPWRELPWGAVPFYSGKPWFLPLVGAYYRTLDRME